MKKILTVIATIAMLQTAFAQDGKNYPAVKGAVQKAQAAASDAKKGANYATWIKLGDALIEAYDAPSKDILPGMDRTQLKLILGNAQPSSSENVVIAGENMVKEVYGVINLYLSEAGNIGLIEVTEPAVENALDRAIEAYKKAYELDVKGKKHEDVVEKLSKIAEKLNADAANAFYFDNASEASKLFEKEYNLLANAPVNKPDQLSLYNAGFTAHMAGEDERAESILKQCLDQKYYGEDAGVFKNLYDIYKAQDRKDDLFAVLKQGYECLPQNRDILLLLIEAYSNQGGNVDELFALIDKARANNPEDVYPVYAKGQALEKLGKIEEAAAAYQECQQVDPKYLWGYLGEGFLYFTVSQKYADESQNELDDAKYEILRQKWEDSIKKALPAFLKSYEVAEDAVQKGEIAKYVKELSFVLRNTDEQYMKIYEEYNKIVEAL